jgi:hypothetical protein
VNFECILLLALWNSLVDNNIIVTQISQVENATMDKVAFFQCDNAGIVRMGESLRSLIMAGRLVCFIKSATHPSFEDRAVPVEEVGVWESRVQVAHLLGVAS